ncbi:putative T7SS-secreted protein [Amycolatopsis panacis]|uniref:Putative T7SS secretion signal domain-containing protein n=1 Tax=Amycolatopsis panacis TaxID=2340917 RepID=A0A419I9R4_9PSEU|nr:hypothetical protein [Amycolatopsis panacis]RJQ89648.1 hypothetical protein D5S19_04150 [Amycolatopsis panacis]
MVNWDRVMDAAVPVQTGSYPALGFDPAPGVVARVVDVAAVLGQVATEMGQAYEDLARLGRSDGFWEGEGAEAFRTTVGEVPDYLSRAHRSLSGASGTLGRWAEDLGTMQRQAAELEREAGAAQARVRSAGADPDLRLAGQTFTDPVQLQQAQEALGRAQLELERAQGEVDALRESASRLLGQHGELAGQVAAALRKARDEAPDEPGLFDRIGDALGKVAEGIKDLAGKAWDWVQQHADIIAAIGDVLSTVGNVLGVVALATSWIPGVNAVTAAAAVGVSAAATGTKLLAKAAGADVSWGSIGMDAIGIIPGGKAVAGAKNAVTQATRASRLVSKMPVIGLKTSEAAVSAGKAVDGAGKLVKSAGNLFDPITFKALRENPAAAINQAAISAHGNAVQLANKIPGVSVAPFTASGVAVGTAVRGTSGQGVKEGIHYGVDKVSGKD